MQLLPVQASFEELTAPLEGAGFAADTNKIDLILRSGEVVDFRKGSKSEVAELLVSFLSARFFNEPI